MDFRHGSYELYDESNKRGREDRESKRVQWGHRPRAEVKGKKMPKGANGSNPSPGHIEGFGKRSVRFDLLDEAKKRIYEKL